MTRTKLVTGVRPTGDLHLGNYFGALRDLADLQNRYDAHVFIADIHSLTTHPRATELGKRVIETAKSYLAAGLDPGRCTFYVQSALAAEICELHTYLSMVMPLGDLLRCPTFKEKAKRHPDNVNYGLVGYPVLMAADVLLHHGEAVPVGEDQLPHLEIARSIARRFNRVYGTRFPEPQPVAAHAVRLPSLSGNGKMSKSDDPDSCIGLDDDPDAIAAKTMRAYSDPLRRYRHEPGHPTPDGCNVFRLHTFVTDAEKRERLATGCLAAEIGCTDCKRTLAESIASIVEPFRQRKRAIRDADVAEALALGRDKARESAQRTLAEVRRAIGLMTV
jgi:tryptophanyl-tRNA synthetase